MIGILGILALLAPPGEGDWAQWRGPKRDGVSAETGLLAAWPAGGPALLWKAEGLGAGYSSVSVAGDRLYTLGDSSAACELIALNREDGKPLWKARVGAPVGHNRYPGPRSSPSVDGARIWVLGQHGDLVCFEAADGKEVWRKNLASDFGGQQMSGWRWSESPLVDGELVVATPGGAKGAVIALKKDSGETAWRCTELTDKAGYASLVPVEIGGLRQYLAFTEASVAGVSAKDGKLLWRAPREGKTAVVPTPIEKDGLVYVTSGYGIGHHAFQVSGADGAFSAKELYRGTEMVNHHGGVIRVGDHVYGLSDGNRREGGGGLTCVELKTGKAVWRDPSVGKGAVAYADGHLYVRSERSGTMALVEATPTGYKEKGRFEQPERSKDQAWPHPVVAGGRLYLRDQDRLFCYDVKAN